LDDNSLTKTEYSINSWECGGWK